MLLFVSDFVYMVAELNKSVLINPLIFIIWELIGESLMTTIRRSKELALFCAKLSSPHLRCGFLPPWSVKSENISQPYINTIDTSSLEEIQFVSIFQQQKLYFANHLFLKRLKIRSHHQRRILYCLYCL